MVKIIVRLLDFLISIVLGVLFMAVGLFSVLFSIFKKEKKRHNGIIELYISIIDFREAVLSTQVNDILLDGMVEKAFCYHFDFDKKRDEDVRLADNVRLRIKSVHPENAFTNMGFRKTAACLAQFRAFFEMLGTAGSEGVNVVRAQDPHLLGFNAYLLSRILKVPFIVQICSNYELKDRAAKGLTFRPFLFKSVERAFENFIMKSSDLVLTDREHYRSFGLIPKDLPQERYANMGFFADVVHNEPPERRGSLRKELGVPGDKKMLLYVGRLCAVKHTVDLVRILDGVLKEKKDVILVVAGDGDLKDDMKALAGEIGLAGNILFPGKLSQKKLADLYNTADIACFTSAGFTMIEAALAAKPIVAYDFEWHDEFIGDNERGVLVPFGDHRRFAEEVVRLIDDGNMRKKYGDAARAYAISNYSRARSVEKERAAYLNVFKRRGYVIEEVL